MMCISEKEIIINGKSLSKFFKLLLTFILFGFKLTVYITLIFFSLTNEGLLLCKR